MIRLFQIEWIKNKSNPTFWILIALYVLGVYMVCSLGTVLMNATINITSNSPEPIAAPIINIYDFPDIWHNLTYIASYLRIFLGIIVIISISNELAYRTMRQNIIDGLSHLEFLSTKLIYLIVLGVLATTMVFFVSYSFGLRYAEFMEPDMLWSKIEFVGAFFIQAVSFMSLALFIGLMFRSNGLAIVFTIAYSLFIETIFKWIFLDSEGPLAKLLPIQSMDNLIQAPFNMFDPESAQTNVDPMAMGIALGWFIVFSIGSYFLLKNKDL
ncbi:MAG: hypothetical protein JXR07_06855 [Reichenbachiella sp.]